MQASQRLRDITGGGSDGWDIVYHSARLKGQGIDVVELTIGEHDIPTDPMIFDAMREAGVNGYAGYQSFHGQMGLRERIAARVAERTGAPTTPDNVLIVPGGQAGLFAAHMLTCDPGDTALHIDPYYATYPGTIRSVGAIPRAVRADAARNFAPAEADLDKAADGAVSLLINSPNNPTGVVYGRDTWDGIARVCRDHDLWLISDEVYDTQVWQGDHISPRALPDMAERTLVVGSMSKSHTMTGSRIGWVIGPPDAVDLMGDLATNTTYGVAGFVQMGASFALDQGTEFEERIAAPFRRRRDLVLRVLEGQNTVRPIPAEGAMYVMVDIRATGMSGDDFATAFLDECHVAVMPGESFGAAAAGHIRIALTVADDRLEAAMNDLVAFAQART